MTAGKSWWELSPHTFRSHRDKGQAPCRGCDNNSRESPCWGPRAGAWHIVLASKRIQDEQGREIKEGSQSYLHMETVAWRDAILCPISQSCSTSKSSGAPNSPKSQLSALIKNCFRAWRELSCILIILYIWRVARKVFLFSLLGQLAEGPT